MKGTVTNIFNNTFSRCILQVSIYESGLTIHVNLMFHSVKKFWISLYENLSIITKKNILKLTNMSSKTSPIGCLLKRIRRTCDSLSLRPEFTSLLKQT